MTTTIETIPTMNPDIEIVRDVRDQSDALRFYQNSRDSLSASIYREHDAVDVSLGALATGRMLGLAGPPGGGKTTIMECVPKLVEENLPNIWIPGGAELTGNQVTGAEVSSTKELSSGEGVGVTETVRQIVDGLVKPEAGFISVDEGTRMMPFVFNSLLSLMESKRLESSAGIKEMENLLMMMVTFNPGESKQATFPLSYATGSRIAAGAAMGLKGDREERKDYIKGVREIRKNHRKAGVDAAEAIVPTVSVSGVDALGKYLLSTPISDSLQDKIDDVALNVADYLADHKIVETDRRLGFQIEETARSLVMRNQQREITDKDIFDATRSAVVARLASRRAFSNKNELDGEIQSLTNL